MRTRLNEDHRPCPTGRLRSYATLRGAREKAIGLVLAVQANTYDPASDFVSVDSCVVVAVREYDTYSNHISSPRATWRRFAYDISIVNTTSVLDGGIVDSRLIGQTCDAPRAACGTPFNVSEIRPCWRRAPGVEDSLKGALAKQGAGALQPRGKNSARRTQAPYVHWNGATKYINKYQKTSHP